MPITGTAAENRTINSRISQMYEGGIVIQPRVGGLLDLNFDRVQQALPAADRDSMPPARILQGALSIEA
jgi:hypothetical protein